MAEIIKCPTCQSQLQLPDGLRGQNVQCPKCSALFVTAGSAPAPAPLALADEPTDSGRFRRQRRRYDDDKDDDDDHDDWDYHRHRRRRDYLPHRGSAVLTMGILSLVLCWPILGPIAWVMGSNDMRDIRAGRMDPEGESSTNAGRICGIIATILGLSILCLYGFIILVATMGAGARGFR